MLALVCVLLVREMPRRKTVRRAGEVVMDDDKAAVGVAH
jgi:hypothetical protein